MDARLGRWCGISFMLSRASCLTTSSCFISHVKCLVAHSFHEQPEIHLPTSYETRTMAGVLLLTLKSIYTTRKYEEILSTSALLWHGILYPYSDDTTIQSLLAAADLTARHYPHMRKNSKSSRGWHSQACARNRLDTLRARYVSLLHFPAYQPGRDMSRR